MPETLQKKNGSGRLLVIGADGMLGRALARTAAGLNMHFMGVGKQQLDVTQPPTVRMMIGNRRPDVVVNLAAYNAVDRAEDEPAIAMAVNRDGAANVAAAARDIGARLIHLSTDYVFRGDTDRPYRPDDEASPVNVYGHSKLLGEDAVRSTLDDYVVLRTSWMFAPWGRNFVRTIAQLASERDEVRVVSDQIGRPTYAIDLAEAILTLAFQRKVQGTLHFANSGPTSWYEFAITIVDYMRQHNPAIRARITPATSSEYGARAERPRYSVLDTDQFTAATGMTPRSWRSALSETVAALTAES